MKKLIVLGSVLFSTLSFAGGKVFFVSPKNNAVVTPKFDVEFGVEGMSVKKAGEMTAMTGHHHLIVDGKPVATGTVVPKDATHIHFGDGSTKTSIELKPGKHTLTLQFADGAHKSYGDEMSATINVEVK